MTFSEDKRKASSTWTKKSPRENHGNISRIVTLMMVSKPEPPLLNGIKLSTSHSSILIQVLTHSIPIFFYDRKIFSRKTDKLVKFIQLEIVWCKRQENSLGKCSLGVTVPIPVTLSRQDHHSMRRETVKADSTRTVKFYSTRTVESHSARTV